MDPGLVEQVERAREGDLDAFCYLTTGTRGAALAMARSILSDPHEAEDAVQEAYLLAFRRLGHVVAIVSFPGADPERKASEKVQAKTGERYAPSLRAHKWGTLLR